MQKSSDKAILKAYSQVSNNVEWISNLHLIPKKSFGNVLESCENGSRIINANGKLVAAKNVL